MEELTSLIQQLQDFENYLCDYEYCGEDVASDLDLLADRAEYEVYTVEKGHFCGDAEEDAAEILRRFRKAVAVMDALGRFGPGAREAAPVVVALLSPWVRATTVDRLPRLFQKELRDHIGRVRVAAARAIGNIGVMEDRTRRILLLGMGDGRELKFAVIAGRALWTCRDRLPVIGQILLGILTREDAREGVWDPSPALVRESKCLAARALCQIGHVDTNNEERVIEQLSEALLNNDVVIRRAAAWVIGRIGPRACLLAPRLSSRLILAINTAKDRRTRNYAAEALKRVVPNTEQRESNAPEQ